MRNEKITVKHLFSMSYEPCDRGLSLLMKVVKHWLQNCS